MLGFAILSCSPKEIEEEKSCNCNRFDFEVTYYYDEEGNVDHSFHDLVKTTAVPCQDQMQSNVVDGKYFSIGCAYN